MHGRVRHGHARRDSMKYISASPRQINSAASAPYTHAQGRSWWSAVGGLRYSRRGQRISIVHTTTSHKHTDVSNPSRTGGPHAMRYSAELLREACGNHKYCLTSVLRLYELYVQKRKLPIIRSHGPSTEPLQITPTQTDEVRMPGRHRRHWSAVYKDFICTNSCCGV